MSSIPGNDCPLLRNPRTSSDYQEVVICNGPLCFTRQRKKKKSDHFRGFQRIQAGQKNSLELWILFALASVQDMPLGSFSSQKHAQAEAENTVMAFHRSRKGSGGEGLIAEQRMNSCGHQVAFAEQD